MLTKQQMPQRKYTHWMRRCVYHETVPHLLFEIESLLNYLYAFCTEMMRGGNIKYVVIGPRPVPYGSAGLAVMYAMRGFGYGYGGGFIHRTRYSKRGFSYAKPWSKLGNTNYYDHISYVPQTYFIYRKMGCFQWHALGSDGSVVSGVGDIPADA